MGSDISFLSPDFVLFTKGTSGAAGSAAFFAARLDGAAAAEGCWTAAPPAPAVEAAAEEDARRACTPVYSSDCGRSEAVIIVNSEVKLEVTVTGFK